MTDKIVISPLFETLTRPPGQIIHIGGGAERNLPVYLASGAGKITLVEADPAAAEALEARVAAHSAVQVIPAAVSASSGMRPYYRMSLPDLNGFRAPEGMRDLFPGLTQISDDPLTPVSPVDLILGLLDSSKTGDGINILVIEVLGETVDILRALAVTGQLARFELLALRTARAPLYGNTISQGEFTSILEDAGFELIAPPGGDDPDMPVFLARPNRKAALIQEIADLKATCASDQDRLATVIAERDATRGALDEAQAQQNALHDKLQTSETDRETARAELAALRGEFDACDTARAAALGQVTELTETLAALQASLAECETARDAALGQVTELTETVAALQDQVAECETARDAALAQVTELTDTVAALQDQVAELQEEPTEAPLNEATEKEAEIAQALDQAENFRNEMYRARGQVELREADLLDLQTRYRKLNETKETQDALLADLARDLDTALALLKPAKEQATSKATSSKAASSKSTRPKPAGAARAKS